MARRNSRSPRGFAAMDPEEQRQIAAAGGRAAHRMGVAHEWNSQEAAEAGRRGGSAPHVGRGRAANRATNPSDKEQENKSRAGSSRSRSENPSYREDDDRDDEKYEHEGSSSHG